MPEIDNLSISIKTSADSAEKSLDRLVDTIGRISASLGGVNFNGFAQGAKNLSTAMQGLQNVKMPDYTRLAKGIEKIGSINSAQIQSAGTAIRELSSSLRFLDDINVSDNAKQIAQLANGISQLGYKSSTKAIDNIPKLATAMRELMATLSTAPRVSQNIIDMTNALAKLSRTGASSGRAATSLGKALDAYTLSTSRASKGSWSLASTIGKLYATYWLLFRAFGKIGDAIDISSSLTEVQNVVDVTFGEYASLVEKMSETSIADFGMSELTVKQVASRFQAMGSAMGFAQGKMADMSIELTKLTADMASFYNVEQTDVAEDLESIFTGQTRPLRTYGLDLTEATLKEWALKQGMDANIDSMTQMEKTMLRYQYVLANTTSAQGDFLRTADTWANQTRILKQNFEQLGAIIGGTFINMLKPLVKALNNVMSHIIAFAETVSNALGKIFGWKYEVGGGGVTSDLEDGAGYSDDIASGLDDAQKNAKKMRDYVLGIDELNIISPETETSTSGGGTGGAGGATGGQWVEQDSLFKEFESEIDTLYELGETIRDALIGAMESIDWESVYEKARGFGKGLAEFLNGLLAYDGEGRTLFGEVGKTFANTLNTIIYSAQSFAKEFDFYQFGVNLADGINQFFSNFDFEALANTLNTWVDGLQETIKGFFEKLEWNTIFSGIGEFLGNLDGDTILTLIGIANLGKFKNSFSKAISSLFSLPTGTETDANGKTSGSLLGTAEAVDGLTLSFDALSVAMDAVVASAVGLVVLDTIKDPMIDMLGSMTDNEQKAEELKETYDGLYGSIMLLRDSFVPLTSIFTGLPSVMGGASNASLAMSEAFDKIAEGGVYTDEQLLKMQETWSLTTEDIESLRQAMIDANPEVFELTKSFDSLEGASFETLEDAATGLKAIKDGFVDANDAFSEYSKPMWGMTEDALAFFETIQNGETSLDKFNEQMSGIGENISNGLTEGAENADVESPSKNIFERFVDSIKSVFGIHSPAEEMKPLGEYIFLGIVEGFTNNFEEFTTSITDFWENYVSPWFTTERWSELWGVLKTSASEKWTELKTWWSETTLSKWFEEDVKPWFTAEKWSELYSTIKTELENKWGEVVNWWTTSGIYRWYNDNVKPWFDKENWNFSGIKDGLKSAWENAIEAIKSVWNTFANWFNSKMTLTIPAIEIAGETIFDGKSIEFIKLPTFYTGGFPESASLFWANENGVPEMVGTIGGRTAVASGVEITGIQDAVYATGQTEASLLQTAVSLLQIIADKEFGVELDGRELLSALDERRTRNGYAF